MFFAPGLSQIYLVLSLPETLALVLAVFGRAMGAGDTFFKSWIRPVGGGDGFLAGMAEFVFALNQIVAEPHPFIKDKALAFPETFFLRDGFKIFQYPSLEMIDLVNAKLFHIG